ncbi:uncharacterized protein LOC142979316 [Anticarsia gemmatalis]|uniref:uncharacterized protein LOC142979316 n=1 Tax=Anticarsia gemmatalis TaxID=129554 RepID=UPI003F767413
MWEQLSKFGSEHCDLPTMMWNVAAILRVLTLNIDNRYKEGIPFYYYIITIVTTACFIYVFVISMAWCVFVLCPQTGDLVAAMVVLSLGITGEIGPAKLACMFFYIEKIREIGDNYLEYDAETVPGTRFHTNQQKTLKLIKKRAMIYWTVIVGNGVLYLTKPLVLPGRNLPENYFVIYGLEPMFESPNYEIAFALMSAGVYVICYVPACVTTYLIVMAGYTEAQLLALSEELIELWPDSVKHVEAEMGIDNIDVYEANNKKAINEQVGLRLKEIIRRHAVMGTLFRGVEEVFRGAIAMGFVLLILGLLSELLGKLENTYLQTPFACMQVLMDCFTGQRVMDASIVLEQAVYDCQWENFDKTNRKMVLVMLQNSQKTLTLSAGGLAMLSFTCAMTIMRGIYTSYTALRSMV